MGYLQVTRHGYGYGFSQVQVRLQPKVPVGYPWCSLIVWLWDSTIYSPQFTKCDWQFLWSTDWQIPESANCVIDRFCKLQIEIFLNWWINTFPNLWYSRASCCIRPNSLVTLIAYFIVFLLHLHHQTTPTIRYFHPLRFCESPPLHWIDRFLWQILSSMDCVIGRFHSLQIVQLQIADSMIFLTSQ